MAFGKWPGLLAEPIFDLDLIRQKNSPNCLVRLPYMRRGGLKALSNSGRREARLLLDQMTK